MILTSLRANQLSPAAAAWYVRYLNSFESRDVDAYLAFLAIDCVAQSNSRLPYYGHAGLRKSLARYFNAFDAIVHEPLNIYGSDDHFGAEMLSHFTPAGAAEAITTPSTTFYDRNSDGLLVAIRYNVDASPLHADRRKAG